VAVVVVQAVQDQTVLDHRAVQAVQVTQQLLLDQAQYTQVAVVVLVLVLVVLVVQVAAVLEEQVKVQELLGQLIPVAAVAVQDQVVAELLPVETAVLA
jgi:hypothetical protein